MYNIQKEIQIKKLFISTKPIYKLMPLSHAFKWQSSMKSPCGILWKGVLEPLMDVCTDLEISKESNLLIQVRVM